MRSYSARTMSLPFVRSSRCTQESAVSGSERSSPWLRGMNLMDLKRGIDLSALGASKRGVQVYTRCTRDFLMAEAP